MTAPDPVRDVRRARWADATALSSLIAASAHELPLAAWLVPDGARRATVLAAAVRILVEEALLRGDVRFLADRSAVAVWINRLRPVPAPTNLGRRLFTACGGNADRIAELGRLLDERRPAQAHRHLAFLAVAPGSTGAGRGSGLVQAYHLALDRGHLAAYAEAVSPRQRDFFLHHGYVEREPLHLPCGLTMYPMWRPAAVHPGT